VNLATHRATILGFPRDSWVPIPGHGTTKINEAMVFGGPSLLIRTLENLTGIHIDLWMLTSFPGLIDMVDGIGGLSLFVPYHMHDPFSHAFLTRGRHHLSGRQALAFSRDRHDVPGGDLSRSKDQGILIVAALSELRTEFAADPGAVLKWIGVGWIRVRSDLSLATLLSLGLTATQIPPGNVDNLVVPATTGTVGAASVVFISSSARTLYRDMRSNGVVGS
jgi:LCP family protein required for cell wall assembly